MTENPYESTDQPHGNKRPKSALGILGAVLAVTVILLLLVALWIPAQRGVPEVARRNTCLNNVKQIMLALLSYEEEHGELPPAYTVDANGNRLHSWRTLILPYMETEDELYAKIDLTKPWDDPANDEARESTVEAYLCPSAPYDDLHLTTYVAAVGPEFLFNGSTPRKLEEVTDGTSNTIAIVEIGHEHAVHWMSPEDVDEHFVLNMASAFDTAHPHEFMAGFADGSVHMMETDTDREALRKQLTIAGREIIDDED